MTRLTVYRAISHLAPSGSIGYDAGNAVAELFLTAVKDGVDPDRIHFPSIRIEKLDNPPAIRITATTEDHAECPVCHATGLQLGVCQDCGWNFGNPRA